MENMQFILKWPKKDVVPLMDGPLHQSLDYGELIVML